MRACAHIAIVHAPQCMHVHMQRRRVCEAHPAADLLLQFMDSLTHLLTLTQFEFSADFEGSVQVQQWQTRGLVSSGSSKSTPLPLRETCPLAI